MALREWTEHELKLLQELWGTNLSTTEIGRQIGGRSKNSIIGKASRLGLPNRPSPIKYGGAPSPVIVSIPRPGQVTLPSLKSIQSEAPVVFRPAPASSNRTC